MAALHLFWFSMASSQGPWSVLVLPGTLSVVSGSMVSEYRSHTHGVSVLQSPALASLDLGPRFRHGSSVGVVTSCRQSLVYLFITEKLADQGQGRLCLSSLISSSVISLPLSTAWSVTPFPGSLGKESLPARVLHPTLCPRSISCSDSE